LSKDVLVYVTRGSVVENTHRGAVAVADTYGNLVCSTGNTDRVLYLRSSGKPIQAIPVAESGATERFQLTETELAVITGSHGGERVHVEAVKGILSKIGLPMTAIKTGPVGEEAITHGCSGQHAGMLLYSQQMGWPVESYLQADHHVQRSVLKVISELSDMEEDRIKVGVDGCGVPTFGLPLSSIARIYARIADQDSLDGRRRLAVRKIVDAMRAHPEMVSPTSGAIDTDLMRYSGRKLVAKTGAAGLISIALFSKGLGVAVKCEDGNFEAVSIAAIETLRKIGALEEGELEKLRKYCDPAVLNSHGTEVGRRIPVFSEAYGALEQS